MELSKAQQEALQNLADGPCELGTEISVNSARALVRRGLARFFTMKITRWKLAAITNAGREWIKEQGNKNGNKT